MVGRDSRGDVLRWRVFWTTKPGLKTKNVTWRNLGIGRIPRFSGARDYNKKMTCQTLEDWDIFPTIGVTASQTVNVFTIITRYSKCIYIYICISTYYTVYILHYLQRNFSFQTTPTDVCTNFAGDIWQKTGVEAKNPVWQGKDRTSQNQQPSGDLCRYGMYLSM